MKTVISFKAIAFGSIAYLVLCAAVAFAQPNGPLQPEFATPSVSAGPDVNTFTGGFTFGLPVLTVPGPNGSDYSLNLSYTSGTPAEQGASWVGYGWSLNPGAVVRDVKGFPDDWKNNVKVWNKVTVNWTATATVRGGVEMMSRDLSAAGGAGGKAWVSYNNATGYRRGFSLGGALGVEEKGLAGIGYSNADGQTSTAFAVSPAIGFPITIGATLRSDGSATVGAWTSLFNLTRLALFSANINRTEYTPYTLASPRFTGKSTNIGTALNVNAVPSFHLGIEAGGTGAYTEQQMIANYITSGVGTMYSAEARASDLLDYSAEKSGTFHENDRFLPIPFSSEDEYFVSGGGPVGSIRLHARRSGLYHPDSVVNHLDIDQFALETMVSARFGLGASVGLGSKELGISQWDDGLLNNEYRFDSVGEDEGYFFRYRGDLGGNVLKAHDDKAVQASTLLGPPPRIPDNYFALANEGVRSGRSLYVGYNLNRKLALTTDLGVPYYAYNRSREYTSESPYLSRSESGIADQIGELAIMSNGGYRYVYGLPVYARMEKRLNFGVAKTSADSASTRIQSRYVVYSWVDTATGSIVVGEERDAPYAMAHLLTLITTPDYVDLTNDGPTVDDLGGYIKFNYTRAAGTAPKVEGASSAWYQWRMPYSGLLYNRNSLSDPNDDVGSYMGGEREQYYLQSIETKTHIAILVTNATSLVTGGKTISGSNVERRDAYQAPFRLSGYVGENYMMAAAGDSTASYAQWFPKDGPSQVPAANVARRLERIELYTKDSTGAPDSLLSTVRFEYDYSLRSGMPNSITKHPDSTGRAGMLTLKRVWSESQRVHNARISPYEFHYEYKRASDYPASVRQLYPEIAHFADSLSSAEQNPDYSPLQIDRWGAYQYDGAARRALENPWVNQNPDTTSFDPAAWQLKWIRTPSQGELHIQYEQSDYSYVQDKPALAMVSLKSGIDTSHVAHDDEDGAKYYLNLADLGMADTDRALAFRYRSLLKKMYVDTNDRIFCHLLYALIGDTAHFDNPAFNSEYIDAYGRAKSVSVDSATIGGVKHYGVVVEFGVGAYSVPKKVCLDFVKWNRRGRLQPGDPVPHPAGLLETMWGVLRRYGDAGFNPGDYCKAIDYAHSYLRLPTLAPKRGGGIRVKRLLTFDKGVERDSTLYGTEYIYKTYDEERREYVSSGVAINEPAIGREENALVNVDLVRSRPKFSMKIIAGDDRAQYEGPLGESLLPGAAVGYSRVVVKNIYPGKTNPGFAVEEFYTAREFPFIRFDSLLGASVDYTRISHDSTETVPLASQAATALDLPFHQTTINFGLTQGYRFIINDMHGEPKSSATYGGDFDRPNSWALSGLSQYGYFRPGEKIPVVQEIGDSIRYEDLGKEMDVTFESRTIQDYVSDVSVNGDVSISVAPPWNPFVSGSASVDIRTENLSTHVASKVVRYPAIQKSVVTYADGIYHVAENVAFDPKSGTSLITRTVDGYDKLALEKSPSGHNGEYHAYSIPATQPYPAVGQKAANHRALITSTGGVTIRKAALGSGTASLTFTSSTLGLNYARLARLVPGDLIHLTKTSNGADAGFYHVASKSGATALLHPVSSSSFASHNTDTGTVNIEVVESGYANASGSAVAGIITYGESDSLVRTAGNFRAVEPGGFTPRRRFVDSLNALLARGGGFITPSLVAGMGVKFVKMITDTTDTCATLSDTLWLSVREGAIVLARGAFTWTDSTCGGPSNPHPLVTHLNHLLDSLWGCHIDTAFAAASECDSATYNYRHYDTMCAPCKAFLDSMHTARFDCINYRDNYWIGDLVYIGAAMDTLIDGFKRGTNSYYSATGAIDLQSVLDGTRIQTRLWVSECDTSDHVDEVSFHLRTTLTGLSSYDSMIVYNGPSKARIDSFFTYTSAIGTFKEDTNGYLLYERRFPAATGEGKIFGVRFKRSDTTATRFVCGDTLIRIGGAGRFDLADDGALIYVAADANVAEQEIPCLEFCPVTQRRYRTIDGVIAASAATLDDSNVVSSVEYADVPSDNNPYERGARGKWRSRVGYVYRTSVVGGNEHYNDQRNYADAGVFTSFRLFDFAHPEYNDSTAWMKGDSVEIFSPDGVPLQTRSPLGIRSAMKLGHDRMVPAIVAANASFNSIAFTSFEDDTLSEDIALDVAHSGRYSGATLETHDIATNIRLKVTDQLRQQGALVRFWMKTDGTLVDTGTANIELRLTVGGTVQHYPIRTSNRIARVGEWSLYEVIADDIAAPIDTTITLAFHDTLGDTLMYVDDIKVQPVDAAAACFVYDGRTYRSLASLDNDHFGAYSQYNAEGRVVRTIVETARGVRTVAEAHAHMPMVERPTTGDLMAAREHEGGIGLSSARRSYPPLPEVEEDARGAKVDLLDVELGAGKPKVKLLGGEKPKLPDPRTIVPPNLDSLKAPDASALAPRLPVVEQAKLMAELKELERRRKELESEGKGKLADEKRRMLEAERKRLEEKRAELIRRLGISEDDLKRIDDELEGR